jgi:hypothetical protein
MFQDILIEPSDFRDYKFLLSEYVFLLLNVLDWLLLNGQKYNLLFAYDELQGLQMDD